MTMPRWMLACLMLSIACRAGAAATEAPSSGGIAYPSKPVRFIVPFPPGGSDTVARLVAQRLTGVFGQQIIVDNRAGAGGTVGTEIAAKASSDGYTLLFATASFAITANLYRHLPFDPLRDFTAVAPVCSGPILIVAHPAVEARTSGELVKLAKAKPGALNFASSGTGSITHLAGEIFRRMTGIAITHVPYKGTGPALADVMGGQVQIAFIPLGGGLPFVRSGRLRALGVASAKRSPAAPEIPTVAESGVPGYEAAQWYGVLAPAGVPPRIVARLNAEINALLEHEDTTKQFTALGCDGTPGSSAAFGAFIASELAKWGGVIRAIGLKPE